MPRLLLGHTWAKSQDIVFTENSEEIARIKFQSCKNGRHVVLEAKPSIKISRGPKKIDKKWKHLRADGLPSFWPKNPYPESIFPMPKEKYPEIVPDPHIRTAMSGMLGREFWEIASKSIWDALKNELEVIIEPFDEPEKSAIRDAFGIGG